MACFLDFVSEDESDFVSEDEAIYAEGKKLFLKEFKIEEKILSSMVMSPMTT